MPNDIIFKRIDPETGAYIVEKGGQEMPIAPEGLPPAEQERLKNLEPGSPLFPEVSQDEVLPQPKTWLQKQAETATQTFPTKQLYNIGGAMDWAAKKITPPVGKAVKATGKYLGMPLLPEIGEAIIESQPGEKPAFPELMESEDVQERWSIDTPDSIIKYIGGKIVEETPKKGLTQDEYAGIMRMYPSASKEQISAAIGQEETSKQKLSGLSPDMTPTETPLTQDANQAASVVAPGATPAVPGLNEAIAGIQKMFKAKQNTALSESKAYETYYESMKNAAEAEKKSMDAYKATYETTYKGLEEKVNNLEAAEIKNYWEDKNVFSKIFAALMIGMGEVGRSLEGGTVNHALGIFDRLAEENYNVQKANLALKKDEIGNRFNLLNELRGQFADESQERDAYKALLGQTLAKGLEQASSKFKGTLLEGQLNQTIGQLKMSWEQQAMNLAKTKAEIHALYNQPDDTKQNEFVTIGTQRLYIPDKIMREKFLTKTLALKGMKRLLSQWLKARDEDIKTFKKISNSGVRMNIQKAMAMYLYQFENSKATQPSDPVLVNQYLPRIPDPAKWDYSGDDAPTAVNEATNNMKDWMKMYGGDYDAAKDYFADTTGTSIEKQFSNVNP